LPRRYWQFSLRSRTGISGRQNREGSFEDREYPRFEPMRPLFCACGRVQRFESEPDGAWRPWRSLPAAIVDLAPANPTHCPAPIAASKGLGRDLCHVGFRGRFSNRPVGVKRFQTVHRHGVWVTRGRVLLSGIGTGPFHHGIRERGGTIYWAALPLAGPSDRADSPHPSSREGHIPPLGGTRASSYCD